jgi:hypothetical protein
MTQYPYEYSSPVVGWLFPSDDPDEGPDELDMATQLAELTGESVDYYSSLSAYELISLHRNYILDEEV